MLAQLRVLSLTIACRLVSRVMPVMRRALTNERTRLRQVEMRLGKKSLESTLDEHGRKASMSTPQPDCTKLQVSMPIATSDHADQKSGTQHHSVDSEPCPLSDPFIVETLAPIEGSDDITYHLYVIQHDHRRLSPVTFTPSSFPGMTGLKQYVNELVNTSTNKAFRIKVWGPHGVMNVEDEEEWAAAIASVQQVGWLYRLNVLVTVVESEQLSG